MPIRLESKVYKTVVRPVALYGSECWPATAKHEQALHVMEMRMLRWCLGLTRYDHAMNDDWESRQTWRKCGKEGADGMDTLYAAKNTRWRGPPCASTLKTGGHAVEPRNDGWIESRRTCNT